MRACSPHAKYMRLMISPPFMKDMLYMYKHTFLVSQPCTKNISSLSSQSHNSDLGRVRGGGGEGHPWIRTWIPVTAWGRLASAAPCPPCSV